MDRRDTILKLIVEHFIKTAMPVGSQTLLEEYKLDCSSATIRNEMNALEKEGLLEKPHASSGRVPSKLGYEYYVEHLRDDRLDDSVKYAIQSVLDKRAQSVEEVIRQSCEILSNMTNLASVVLGPKVSEERLVSIQVIPLNGQTATAVFVTDQGYVENKTFILDDSVSMDDVKKTVENLNLRLQGTPISELVGKMEAMRPALTDYMVGQDVIYQAIFSAFLKFASSRMSLYGKSNLLSQPEYQADASKLRQLLGLLDSPEELRHVLSESADAGDLKIKIGGEDGGIEDVGVVSAEVRTPGGQSASISLLGPKRMDYDKAMGLLSYVAEQLDRYFQGEAGAKKGDSQCQKKKTKAK